MNSIINVCFSFIHILYYDIQFLYYDIQLQIELISHHTIPFSILTKVKFNHSIMQLFGIHCFL